MERVTHTEASQNRAGLLTILAGPTAAGKSSVQNELLLQFPASQRVISTTTRPRRHEEVEGVDYHFTSREEFLYAQKNDQFVEWVEYAGVFYGVEKEELEAVVRGEDRIWIINMGRAIEIKDFYAGVFDADTAQLLKEHTLVMLIGIPSIWSLWERYRERGLDKASFVKRMQEDWDVWKHHAKDFDHVVINEVNNLPHTVSEVAHYIKAKKKSLKGKEKEIG